MIVVYLAAKLLELVFLLISLGIRHSGSMRSWPAHGSMRRGRRLREG